MKAFLRKLPRLARQFFMYVAVFFVVSFGVDYVRAPKLPESFSSRPVWQDIHGQPVDVIAMSEKSPVLVYFWGSWCGVCRVTSPSVDRLHDDGVAVLGVAMASGDEQAVKHYLKQHDWQFNSVSDETGELSSAWGVGVAPSLLIIKDGKIRHATTGFSSYWGLKARLLLSSI
ncbi:MAG: protein disulfide oxidoreductase [Moraxella sp.]|nr:protein disulfide oxidoreductase [Moraxella sp.]